MNPVALKVQRTSYYGFTLYPATVGNASYWQMMRSYFEN